MNKYLILLFFIILSSCNKNKEQIGYCLYDTKIDKVNSGEFEGLVFKYKAYYLKNKYVNFSVLVTAQKLDFETENDTIFGYGKIEVQKSKDTYKLFAKEIYINGYQKYNKCDSVIREYKQTKNGKINFMQIYYYYEGKIKKFKFPKQEVLPDSIAPPPPPDGANLSTKGFR